MWEGELYCIKGTNDLIQNLIDSLASYADVKGRNLSFDRHYASIPIAEWLLEEKQLTCIETQEDNWKSIPVDITAVKQREVLSYEIYRGKENNVMITFSHVVKTSTGTKNVLILSTYEPILGVTKDARKEIGKYKVYDFTKRGTDIHDHSMGFYATKTKCKRWNIKTAFSYVQDTAGVNA